MSSDSASILNGKLTISGKIINLESEAVDYIQVRDKVVVRLETPYGSIKNDNIICFDLHGKLLWTIQPSQHGNTEDNPFMQIRKLDDLKFIAQNWNGVEYQVTLDNGKISPVGLERF